MEHITRTFAALSDPIRLRILALIAHETELCVCELVDTLDMPQPKISRHCKVLAEAGLLISRRNAQWVLHSLPKDMPQWADQALSAAIAGIRREPLHLSDLERLKTVERPIVRCA